jgi:hypothetical protein
VVLVTPVVRPPIANDKGKADENDVVEEGLFKGLKRMGDKTPFNQGDSNANPVQVLKFSACIPIMAFSVGIVLGL